MHGGAVAQGRERDLQDQVQTLHRDPDQVLQGQGQSLVQAGDQDHAAALPRGHQQRGVQGKQADMQHLSDSLFKTASSPVRVPRALIKIDSEYAFTSLFLSGLDRRLARRSISQF